MNPADLKPGHLYRLTQDVVNPVVDGRSSNKMLKRPTFLKGTYFIGLCDDDYPSLIRLTHNEYQGEGDFTVGVRRENGIQPPKREQDAAWAAVIVPHLEEVEINSWGRIQRVFGFSSMTNVLHELFDDGTVPLERLLDLMRKNTLGAGIPPSE
jgi:hypothetical protein